MPPTRGRESAAEGRDCGGSPGRRQSKFESTGPNDTGVRSFLEEEKKLEMGRYGSA